MSGQDLQSFLQQLNQMVQAALQGVPPAPAGPQQPRGGRGGQNARVRSGSRGRGNTGGRGGLGRGGQNPPGPGGPQGAANTLKALLQLSPEIMPYVSITSVNLLNSHGNILNGLVKAHAEYRYRLVTIFRSTVDPQYLGKVSDIEGQLRRNMKAQGATDRVIFRNMAMLVVAHFLRLLNVALGGCLARAPVNLPGGGVDVSATAIADAGNLNRWLDGVVTLPFNQDEVDFVNTARTANPTERAQLDQSIRHCFADLDTIHVDTRAGVNRDPNNIADGRQVTTFTMTPRQGLDLAHYRIQASLTTMANGGSSLV
jgi:hypothetical protein